MRIAQRRYLESLPKILPVLEEEYKASCAALQNTRTALQDLEPGRYATLHCETADGNPEAIEIALS